MDFTRAPLRAVARKSSLEGLDILKIDKTLLIYVSQFSLGG